MIRLLPSVCRDCGKSAEEVPLSPYLDFRLCGGCISRREREVMALDSKRRVPAVEAIAAPPARRRRVPAPIKVVTPDKRQAKKKDGPSRASGKQPAGKTARKTTSKRRKPRA